LRNDIPRDARLIHNEIAADPGKAAANIALLRAAQY
jgi:hypothetical protein